MTGLTYEFRLARRDDLEGIARVFVAAFPESIQHYFDAPPAPAVVAEPFSLCMEAEPDALYVADAGRGRIAGYIFAPAATSRLPWVAVRKGIIFRWAWRWISGQYRIGAAPIRALTLNKLDFLSSSRQPEVKAEARILSVAVHPEHQGRGIARVLCGLGLRRLDGLGAGPVRLEVRPDNQPAVRLYRGLGFRPAGTTRDSQGDWLIMLREGPQLT
ncbi:MAG TPA: GNAT family N-acetyltransferase [Symbiobacteriaceae bacterium]|nr:GNAT family N-acetyltransferase [Symbiobacteriaceae bacterium]